MEEAEEHKFGYVWQFNKIRLYFFFFCNRGVHDEEKWGKTGAKLIENCGKSIYETELKGASFLAVFALLLQFVPRTINCKTDTVQNSQFRVFRILFYFCGPK